MTQSISKRPTTPAPAAAQALTLAELPALTGFSLADLAEMIRPGGVAAGADNAALVTFCMTAHARGLDPRKGQCFYIQRGGSWTFQTAIYGFAAIAARSGRDGGMDAPRYRGHLAVDVGNKRVLDVPEEVEVTVWKLVGPTYVPRPYTGVAHWTEFSPSDMTAAGASMWRKYPRRMLAKCATAQALRMAFPEELADVELGEERDASIDVEEVRRAQRAEPALPPNGPGYGDIFREDEQAAFDAQTERATKPKQQSIDLAEVDRQRREEGLIS
jgi:hypothetical protein